MKCNYWKSYGEGPKTWIHVFSSIWTLHRYFAGRLRPEVKNKWLRQSRKKISVRLEAQMMNASEICTKTFETESLCTLIGSKWPRPFAEIVGCPGHKTTWGCNGGKPVDFTKHEITRQGRCNHVLGPSPYTLFPKQIVCKGSVYSQHIAIRSALQDQAPFGCA